MNIWLLRIISALFASSLIYGMSVLSSAQDEDDDYEFTDEEDEDMEYLDVAEENEEGEEDKQEDSEKGGSDEPLDDLLALDVTENLDVENVAEKEAVYKFSLLGDDDPFVPKILLAHFKTGDDLQQIQDLSDDTPILQRSPLQNYRLTGIWSVADVTKGLILTPPPTSEGVVVEVGDRIGVKNGTIIEISHKGLVVREVHVDEEHQRKVNDRSLALFDPETGQEEQKKEK